MASRKPAAAAQNTGTATGLAQDQLTRAELRAEYGVTARQLKVSDDLFNLFQRAFEGQWAKERFDSELEQTAWYRKNAAPMRNYLLLKAAGGADWTAKVKDTQEAIRQQAMAMGVNLNAEDIAGLATQSMMYGWGEKGQEYELQRAIAEIPSRDGEYGGDIAKNADMLRATALANGVKLDEQWYQSKAKSIASGLSLPADAERQVREFAAQKTPGFAEEIMAGQDLTALVSPWRRMMADEWEMSETAIPLDDPTLMSAIGGFDEQGKPVKENLGEFGVRLRKDPRWLTTTAGQNKQISAMSGVLKMFGYGN